MMDGNRFGSQQSSIENGGMFNREQLQRLTEYAINNSGKSCDCMEETQIN